MIDRTTNAKLQPIFWGGFVGYVKNKNFYVKQINCKYLLFNRIIKHNSVLTYYLTLLLGFHGIEVGAHLKSTAFINQCMYSLTGNKKGSYINI